jgi:hypothetical protein
LGTRAIWSDPPLRTVAAMTDRATADRLSAALHRWFTDFDVADDLFADDALFDLPPPGGGFSCRDLGVFTAQLRSVAEGPVQIDVVPTVATATGFVTEHVATQQTPRRPAPCTAAQSPTAASPPSPPTTTAGGMPSCVPATPPKPP